MDIHGTPQISLLNFWRAPGDSSELLATSMEQSPEVPREPLGARENINVVIAGGRYPNRSHIQIVAILAPGSTIFGSCDRLAQPP